MPAILTPGEFVVIAEDTSKNLAMLTSINNGYKPASAPATMGGFTGPASMGNIHVTVTNPFTGEQVRGMVTSVARTEANGAIASADAQSLYMRRGR
ncbi:hypothetical protein DBR22_23255 [Arthrobacter sp. HMWF013]|nr:hypothetical protein DBR22_23255 [Arthrobacter sp. HMWF013]